MDSKELWALDELDDSDFEEIRGHSATLRAHIAALDARIEALEGALRRSNAVAKLLKMGMTPNPTDRDESIEQAIAALGGEHGG